MIYIARKNVPCPDILDLNNPDSKASIEKAKAIAHFNDPANVPKVKYTVYNDDSVKLALIKLFNGKCAYCESKLNAVSARDIEHFRPKGQIDPDNGEAVIKPGYYWLAADWENLLLSCPACNRSQRQLERDVNGEFIFSDEATGKHDLFPMRQGAQIAKKPDDDLAQEEPFRLLLNPCLDKPKKHLRYDKNGNIIPRKMAGVFSDRAIKSIDVFQLKRIVLVEERRAKYLDIVSTCDCFELISQMIDTLDVNQNQSIAEMIRKKEKELFSYTKDNQLYAGMARQLIKPFKRRLKAIKTEFKNKYGISID